MGNILLSRQLFYSLLYRAYDIGKNDGTKENLKEFIKLYMEKNT
jgi:hypothetical protein